MTTFLLDLWQDLRQKRLWPVAVALFAATVAVPVVLAKSPSSPPPATMAGADSNADKLPTVTLDASSVSGSHLDVFDTKNPFASAADPTGDGTTPGAPGAIPLGDSVAKAVDKAGDSASSGDPGAGLPGGSPSGDVPKGPDGKPISPGVHYFTYTADVIFGLRSHAKPYEGLRELDVLPDGNNPVVAFMGVRGAKTAVFFIADPAFRADGEGTCEPSPDNCMFLYLSKSEAHDEETLSAQNGQIEYTLKLTDLHVKYLSESEAVGDTTPEKDPGSAAKRRNRTLLGLPAVRLSRR